MQAANWSFWLKGKSCERTRRSDRMAQSCDYPVLSGTNHCPLIIDYPRGTVLYRRVFLHRPSWQVVGVVRRLSTVMFAALVITHLVFLAKTVTEMLPPSSQTVWRLSYTLVRQASPTWRSWTGRPVSLEQKLILNDTNPCHLTFCSALAWKKQIQPYMYFATGHSQLCIII